MSVGQSDGCILDLSDVGEQNPEVQWVNLCSGSGGYTQAPPQEREFFSVWCGTVDHVRLSSGRPQKLLCGCFGGLWWFLMPSKSHVNVADPVRPCQRDEYLQACMWLWMSHVNSALPRKGERFATEPLCKGGLWPDKKGYSTSPGLLLIGLHPHLAQTPVCSLWLWVFTLSVFYRSEVLPLQIQKLSSSPLFFWGKEDGTNPGKASCHLCKCPTVLSHWQVTFQSLTAGKSHIE